MSKTLSRIRTAVLSLAVAGSLAFGAAQAYATVAPAQDAAAACSTWACPECGSLGGVWVPMDGVCYCCG